MSLKFYNTKYIYLFLYIDEYYMCFSPNYMYVVCKGPYILYIYIYTLFNRRTGFPF